MERRSMGPEIMVEEKGYLSGTLLTEIESKKLLKETAGIDVVYTVMATSKKEAVRISKEIGFPVALKIVSRDISHKSDIGGVRLGIMTPNQVAKAYGDILKAVKQRCPEAAIEGVSVQKMVPPGVEVIIGMTKDVQFGPVIMFGLGGIFVEIIKDVSFRIVPLERRDAREMIQEIRGFPILRGYRGKEPIDIINLEDMLLKVSKFAETHPEVKEVDLNPVFAYPQGAIAVDARIILEPGQ
jgi:acyl-CoA synthetase (NDP forming)